MITDWNNDAFEVCETPYGKGIRAKRVILPQDAFGEVLGEIKDEPDYESRYAMDLGGNFSLEPDPPFGWMNHSCDPNCEIYTGERVPFSEWRMFVRVIKRIEPGEQLTIDYCWPAYFAIPCLCGSPNCRGWICDPEELDQIPLYHGDANANTRKKAAKKKKRKTPV